MADFYGEKECGPTHFACDCQIKRMAELERKLEKARDGLKFYVDVCYQNESYICAHDLIHIGFDRGKRARETLKEIEDG